MNGFCLRPVREEDLEQLARLVQKISGGMTSLPANKEFLQHRINDSLRAFDHRISKPGGETYLFVLELVPEGRLVGTSGLLSRVGGFDPFYTYRITTHVQEYAPLKVCNELRTLDLVKNHKGPTEICSLFLDPEFRKHGQGKLLSLARFSFIRAFPERFDREVLAELRGYLDPRGRSPFWEAVGKKFFHSDYYSADVLSGIGEKDFIEALLPEFPIYADLLPYDARNCIGKVHPETRPALQILLREGFSITDEVDIFDAGPIVRARLKDLRVSKALRELPISPDAQGGADNQPTLITNGALDFRATLAPASVDDGILRVDPQVLEILNLSVGDTVHFMQFTEST